MYKQLFKDIILYGLGKGLRRLLGLILLPIYTIYLTPYDYGILEILSIFVSLISIILDAGTYSATMRHYYALTDNDRKILLFNTLIIKLLIVFPVLILLSFGTSISIILFDDIKYIPNVSIAILVIIIDALAAEQGAIYQLKRLPLIYNTFIIIELFLVFSIGYYLVAIKKEGIWGAQVAGFAGLLTITALSIGYNIKNKTYKAQVDLKIIRKLLYYGFPFMITNLIWWIYSLSDRLFLMHYKTMAEIGLYAVGESFSKPIMLLNWAISMAFTPILIDFYEKEKDETKSKTKLLMGNTIKYYLFLGLLVAFMLSFFANDMLALFTNNRFSGSSLIVPFLAFSLVFHQAGAFFLESFNLRKKVFYLIVPMILSSLLNIVLNFYFIPKYSFIGAAFTTLLASICYLGIVFAISNKKFKIMPSFIYIFVTMIFITFIAGIFVYFEYYEWTIHIFAKIIGAIITMVLFYYIFKNKIKFHLKNLQQLVKR